MLKRYGYFLAIFALAAGGLLVILGLRQQVAIQVDGETRKVVSSGLTVGNVLKAAGVAVGSKDLVIPPATALAATNGAIRVEHARPVTLWLDKQQVVLPLVVTERIPANILALNGIRLYPGDGLWVDGQPVMFDRAVPASQTFTLQYRQGQAVTVEMDGKVRTFHSSSATLGDALREAGIWLAGSDGLSLPADTPISGPMQVKVFKARPVRIRVEGNEISTQTSGERVGEALTAAGLTLQGLDFSIPAEDQPLPADGNIQVVRVTEDVALEQTAIPFTTEMVADPETELDQSRVIEAGQAGLKVTRKRVRYEDGKQVSIKTENEWVAAEPVTQKTGYGTKIVVHTMNTPDGPIEYWRAITVYATSYSPCRQGLPKCTLSTASGIPLKKGIVAVRGSWYRTLGLTKVYVADYGVGLVADTGGGIPGKYWIDLGYGEEDFINWHQNVTLYLLTPIPANIPWTLP